MSSSTAMNKYAGGVAEYRSSEGKTVEVLSLKTHRFPSALLENASVPVSTTRERVGSRQRRQEPHRGVASADRVHEKTSFQMK